MGSQVQHSQATSGTSVASGSALQISILQLYWKLLLHVWQAAAEEVLDWASATWQTDDS